MSPLAYLVLLHLSVICPWTLAGSLGGDYSHMHIHNHYSVRFVERHFLMGFIINRSDYNEVMLKGQCHFFLITIFTFTLLYVYCLLSDREALQRNSFT